MFKGKGYLLGTLVTIGGLLILMLVIQSTVGAVIAKEIEVFEGQKVQIPDNVPDYSSWQAEFPRLFPEGLIAVVYDNPATPDIKDDLTEMYNLDNRLLSIDWYDQYGIYKMIMDSGLLSQDKNLTGIFRSIHDTKNTI